MGREEEDGQERVEGSGGKTSSSSKSEDVYKLRMGTHLQAQNGVGAAHQASEVSG